MRIALIAITIPYLLCYVYTGLTMAMSYYYCSRYARASRLPLLSLLRVFLIESNYFALLFATRLFPRQRVRTYVGEGGGPTIVFLHGYVMTGRCFFLLRRRLRRAGFNRFYSISLPRAFAPLDELAAAFAEDLREVLRRAPEPACVVIAHSMGGLVARRALEDPALASRVELLVTLGSPHHGTPVARYVLGANARDMEPGSAFMKRIEPVPPPVPIVSVCSRADNLIFPHRTSMIDGADNRELPLLGHMGMIASRRVAEEVAKVLAAAPRRTAPALV